MRQTGNKAGWLTSVLPVPVGEFTFCRCSVLIGDEDTKGDKAWEEEMEEEESPTNVF